MSASTTRTNLIKSKLMIKKKPIKDLEFSASVNEYGLAVFENIPIGIHKIVVPEF